MVEIITYANKSDVPMLKNLIKTLESNGYKYTVLGKGEKWKGFMTKIRSCLTYTKTLPDDQIIAVVDGYDVFASGPSSEFVERYKSYGYPLVVGAETRCGANCVPLKEWWNHHASRITTTTLQYCNGGFYVGKAMDVALLLQYMLDLGIDDDQIALGTYLNRYPERAMLDTKALLVGNITPGDFKDIDVKGDKFVMAKTGQSPLFIHLPGKVCDLMVRANYVGRTLLGNDYHETTTREVWNEWSKGLGQFFEKNFLPLIAIIMVVWIIIIAIILYAHSILIPFMGLVLIMFIAFVMWYSKFFSPPVRIDRK